MMNLTMAQVKLIAATPEDANITVLIKEKLFTDKDIAAMTIKVETNNGIVSLSGVADNQAQADNAIKIAKTINGVKEVRSTIQLREIIPATS